MQICQAAGATTSRCAESKCASGEAATYTCPGPPPAISVQHTGQRAAVAAAGSACLASHPSTGHSLLDGAKAQMLKLHSVRNKMHHLEGPTWTAPLANTYIVRLQVASSRGSIMTIKRHMHLHVFSHLAEKPLSSP